MAIEDIYAEELIYNYENPSAKGKLANSTVSMHEENVSCGDVITVYLVIKDGKIANAKFEGTGCVISMGTANMLIEHVKGVGLEQLEKMTQGDLLKLITIDPGPVRMHCATLSLRAVKKAVLGYEKKPIDTATKEL